MRLQVSLADLYRGKWGGVKEGWNLLSVPCDIPEEKMDDYKAMLGLEIIWRWCGGRFVEATSLQSDEAFWAYIDRLPDAPRGVLKGHREFTSLRKGWNLRGAYGASLGEVFWGVEKKGWHTMLTQKQEASQGFGYWIFVK